MTRAKLEALQKETNSIAFSEHWFTDSNYRAAIAASIDILELAHTECLERPIEHEEIAPALAFLGERDGKTKYHLNHFVKALSLSDQSQRFEQTKTALLMIRRQVGF